MFEDSVDPNISPALERVVGQFVHLLRSVGRKHGFEPADIDDLIQDVRVRLWKSGMAREKIEALGASYVYRVATSAAIDMLRRRRARREEYIDDDRVTVRQELVLPFSDHAESEEMARRMGDAFAAMNPNRRTVVQLHLEGYDRDEIATLSGWSEAKVRNLLYRGLDDLRLLLTTNDPRA